MPHDQLRDAVRRIVSGKGCVDERNLAEIGVSQRGQSLRLEAADRRIDLASVVGRGWSAVAADDARNIETPAAVLEEATDGVGQVAAGRKTPPNACSYSAALVTRFGRVGPRSASPRNAAVLVGTPSIGRGPDGSSST
jgi:hypothetical protein